MTAKPMKDPFGRDLLNELGDRIEETGYRLDRACFGSVWSDAVGGWARRLCTALRACLPDDYRKAVTVMRESLGPAALEDQTMHEAHKLSPYCCYVSTYGADWIEESLELLEDISKRSYMAQVSIRGFIVAEPDLTMRYLERWVNDSNPNVRRLVTGGTRPRLRLKAEWGMMKLEPFIENPLPLLHLLGGLLDDPSAVVRKSVAGNLSDVLKDNPEAGYRMIEKWLSEGGARAKRTLRHALRYGVKKRDPIAVRLTEQIG